MGSGFGLPLEGDVLLLNGLNPKFEYRNPREAPDEGKQILNSNAQNNQESIHCITVTLFGTLEFWSLEFVSYFGFRASNFVSIYFGISLYL